MIRNAARLTGAAAAVALTVGAVAAPAPAAADTVIGGTKNVGIFDHQMRTGKLDLRFTYSSKYTKGTYCLHDLKGNGDGVGFVVEAQFRVTNFLGHSETRLQKFRALNTRGNGTQVCGGYTLAVKGGKLMRVGLLVANTDSGKFYGSRTVRIK